MNMNIMDVAKGVQNDTTTQERVDYVRNGKIPGYIGICADCFEPIKVGEGFRFHEKGRNFHRKCVIKTPNSHYAKIERRKAERIAQKQQESFGEREGCIKYDFPNCSAADPIDTVHPVFRDTLRAIRGDFS